ncbi:MAG TPA: thioesterase family protein, partial [Sphingomonas sp.]|nr:thioesterase family protein [Sphingomonas sp.]
GEAGLGLRATFVFMRPQASALDHATGRAPDFAVPGPDTPTDKGLAAVPFTQNFESVDRRDEAVGSGEWLRWTRLREREGLDPAVELMAIGDALPPAALKLLGGFAPVSSMTWQINLLGTPATADGWWLLNAATDYARDGSSSQRMMVWNAGGAPVAEHIQSVAVFG